MIRRVAVVNAYVRENGGDAALLSVCLRQVRDAVGPDVDLAIAGMESPQRWPTYDGIPNLGSIRRFVADASVTKGVRIARRAAVGAGLIGYAALPVSARRVLRDRIPGEVGDELRAVATADLVVSIGGGYLQARPGLEGYQNLFFVCAPLAVAVREGRPVVMFPQSYGPFQSGLQRWAVGALLRRAALVSTRESVSVEQLVRCGVPVGQLSQDVDSAFALRLNDSGGGDVGQSQPQSRARRGHDNQQGLLVGMTARSWLPPREQAAYEAAMAAVIDDLMVAGHEVVLLAQVTTDYLGDDDRIVNDRIAAACHERPTVMAQVADLDTLRDTYAGLDLLIGTRFHSVIFALTAHVPCVAVAYEHKTRGIMRELGLERWVVDIDQAAAGPVLVPLVRAALAQRTDYAATLRATIPGVSARAEEMTNRIQALMNAPQPPASRG